MVVAMIAPGGDGHGPGSRSCACLGWTVLLIGGALLTLVPLSGNMDKPAKVVTKMDEQCGADAPDCVIARPSRACRATYMNAPCEPGVTTGRQCENLIDEQNGSPEHAEANACYIDPVAGPVCAMCPPIRNPGAGPNSAFCRSRPHFSRCKAKDGEED